MGEGRFPITDGVKLAVINALNVQSQWIRRSTLKTHSKSLQRSEPSLKRPKARGPVQRDAKEVLAEVLGKLTGKLDPPAVSTSAKENSRGTTVSPDRDSLTVGA